MNRPHRLLVIGTGSIGERHVRCLLGTGRARVSLCEPNDALRQHVAEQYDVTAAYPSLEEALDDSSSGWDSAVIATPADTHIAIARRIAEAGIAPLIEKPLAVEETGLAALQQILEARGLPCGVAYVYRAHPALRAMRQALGDGQFGRPLELVVIAGQHFPTYRPAYAETYYAEHARGGGLIQDCLPHLLNAAEWLVGPATRVIADAAHCKLPNVTVEDTAHVLARHGDVPASYALNQHQAPNETSITVIAERGTARCEYHRHAWQWMSEPDTPWREQRIDFAARDDWFTAQEDAWLDVLAGKAEPLCDLAGGWRTLRATRAVLDSAASDAGWVAVPPSQTRSAPEGRDEGAQQP